MRLGDCEIGDIVRLDNGFGTKHDFIVTGKEGDVVYVVPCVRDEIAHNANKEVERVEK